MGKATVTLEGKDDLKQAFANLSDAMKGRIQHVVEESAAEMEREAKARVAVRTGQTRRKIKTKIIDRGLGAIVGGSWYKLRFLEHGTVKMHARPFLFPAFAMVRPKFLQRISDAFNRAARDA